jgi:hypothetical protein
MGGDKKRDGEEELETHEDSIRTRERGRRGGGKGAIETGNYSQSAGKCCQTDRPVDRLWRFIQFDSGRLTDGGREMEEEGGDRGVED